MISGRFEYSVATKNRIPFPSQFKTELMKKIFSIPHVDRYVTYPVSKTKKLTVCNLLAKMHCDGFKTEELIRQQR
jgi:hypothetical protein